METFKLHSLLAELKEADQWLTELGFKTRNDRFRQSIEIVKEAAQGLETVRRTEHPTRIGTKDNYYFGLVEALELRSVYRAFNELSPQTVRPPLERALSGPSRPPMENKGNAAGRNAMFELALAAEWKLRGGEVRIGEPDIVLIGAAGHSFVVECKRPWSDHSIRPNVRGAAEQLTVKVDGSVGSFGVIAISVSRVLDKGKSLFVVPSGEDAGTRLLQENVVQLFQREKVRWNAAWFGLTITSLLFHAAVAAVFNGTVVRATSTVAQSAGRQGEGSALFERELIRLYGDDVTVG